MSHGGESIARAPSSFELTTGPTPTRRGGRVGRADLLMSVRGDRMLFCHLNHFILMIIGYF